MDQLVYVAGLGRPAADAQPLARALGARLVAAFGVDDPLFEDLAAGADLVAAAAGMSRPVLIGHSMGAFVAECAAYRHPAAFSALVLLDPSIARPQRDGLPPALHEALRQLLVGKSRFVNAVRDNLNYRRFATLTAAARQRYELSIPALIVTATLCLESSWSHQHSAMASQLGASHIVRAHGSHLLATKHPDDVAAIIRAWER